MSKGISYSVTPPYGHLKLVITAKFFKFGPLVTVLTGSNCNDFLSKELNLPKTTTHVIAP